MKIVKKSNKSEASAKMRNSKVSFSTKLAFVSKQSTGVINDHSFAKSRIVICEAIKVIR